MSTPQRRIKTVAILGGGSAGFMAALTLKRKLPDLQVTVIRSPDIGVIGVGEGIDDLQPFSAREFVDALFGKA